MKILVTGSCGFIGTNLCRCLLQNNHEVYGIDNMNSFIYDSSFKFNNLKHLQSYANSFHFIQEDLLTTNQIPTIQPDIIIHLAAYANVRKSFEHPNLYIQNNTQVTSKVIEEILKCSNNPILIYASSSSVYGNNSTVPFSEKDSIQNCMSPYALSKKYCEELVEMYAKTKSIRAIGLRFFTVYGPGGRPDMGIFTFLKKINNYEPIQLYGDGSMKRDFTYVDDIVSGIVKCLNLSLEPSTHIIMNLGNNQPIKILDMIKICESVTGKEAIIETKPIPIGDVPITYADITLANQLIDYQPSTHINEGIKNLFVWMKLFEI